MSRVLIVTLVFAPDGVSTATLISQLAEDLQAKGHTLNVITTVPHYNLEPEARAKQPLRSRAGGLYYRSDYNGIPVWHTLVVRKGKSASGRLIGYLIFNLFTLLIGLFALGRQDIVLVVSPPLTSGVVGWVLALLKGGQFIYNVQELYPDIYVQVNSLRRGALSTRLWYSLERFVYLRARVLTVICGAFRRTIAAKGIPESKIELIPNFVDLDGIRPGSKNNLLARELGLTDKYVVLYAGNLGMTQSFETLIKVAQRVQSEEAVRFLIVGDGVMRDYVAEQIQWLSLHNTILLPYQPRSRVGDIYATADLRLVPLMKGTAQSTVPSKLYTIMASGRPALVAADPDSDIVQTVEAAGCGLAVSPDDADALETGIREAFNHQETMRSLGENGRHYAETHFTRTGVSEQYHQLIRRLGEKP